ncbi:MAG TPA: PHB depolymerase family esterase [Longimicrobium sp.]|jgi:poly(hydroxyalkanoate) depolymerase family esterase
MTRAALLTTALAVTLTNAAAPAAAQDGTFEWATYSGAEGTRRYKLFVPAGRDASKPAPLVVMLHGCTQDPDDFARGTRFNQAAAAAGVLVAWPEQTGTHQPQKCWTWYDPAHQGRGGEPAIIAAITREVIARYNADPARVYIAGVSAGAAMAVNTAAAYPELYAAAGAHSGIAYRAASSVADALGVMRSGPSGVDRLTEALRTALGRRDLPLIVIHGGADPVVSPFNAEQLAHQFAIVADLKGPHLESGTAGGYEVERRWFDDGEGNTMLDLVLVKGLGHAWSGGSPEGTFTDAKGPDATRLILDFLLRHSR